MSFQDPTRYEAQLLLAALFLPRPVWRALHAAGPGAAVIPAQRSAANAPTVGVGTHRGVR